MPPDRTDLLQGVLDLLLLRTLVDEPLHGYALAQRLRLLSQGRLQVPQGSLYPALHRLEYRGLLKGDWTDTATGRQAKVYRVTAKGRRRLQAEQTEWTELSTAVSLVLKAT